MGKKILITGGSGFIGTNLMEYYLNNNIQVLNIDKNPPKIKAHEKYWKKIDILNEAELSLAFVEFKPDYVFHLAARTDLDETKDINGYAANILGVENIIKAINLCNSVKRTIFASSRLVCAIGYQPKNETDYLPSTVYGESKIAGEKIVRASKINCEWCLIRITSIWGPWFDVPYKTLFDSIARGRYINPGNRNPHKSFGFVGNTIFELNSLINCSAEKINNKTFYLGDYPPLILREWVEVIRQELNAKKIHSLPIFALRILACFGDLIQTFGIKAPLTNFRLNNLLTEMTYDLNTIENIAGKLPYTMQEGVKQTAIWYKQKQTKEGS